MQESSSSSFYLIFYNPIFLSAFFSWFFTQFIKTLIILFRPEQKPLMYYINILLWKTGGMPSSHSALAASMATTIGFREGFNSSLFLVLCGYGLLIVRDAVGVRRASGLQARALNNMGRDLEEKFGIAYKPVKEISGHTVSEVLIGLMIGFFIAVAFSTL